MPSFEEKIGEPRPTDKAYIDIIRSELKTDPQYIQDPGMPAKIVYFCPQCKKLIAPKRIGKKFRFSCAECHCNEVAFGTEESITKFYRLPGAPKTETNKKS